MAWWETFGAGRELALFRATRDGKLVGIAPFVLHDGVLGFVGGADYEDLICAPEATEVAAALLDTAVALAPAWRCMRFRNLPSSSMAAQVLNRLERRIRIRMVPCPRISITGRPGALEQVIKKKSLRRHHRHFSRQPGYSVEHFTRADEIRPHLDDFFSQHIGRWADTHTPSLFTSSSQRRFYRSLVERFDNTGWLRFTRVAVDDSAIAYHFGFVFDGVFVWYKPSFEVSLARKSPGEAMLQELLLFAHREGVRAFDFTIGGESFKYRFANEIHENERWVVFRRTTDYWAAKARRVVRELVRKEK